MKSGLSLARGSMAGEFPDEPEFGHGSRIPPLRAWPAPPWSVVFAAFARTCQDSSRPMRLHVRLQRRRRRQEWGTVRSGGGSEAPAESQQVAHGRRPHHSSTLVTVNTIDDRTHRPTFPSFKDEDVGPRTIRERETDRNCIHTPCQGLWQGGRKGVGQIESESRNVATIALHTYHRATQQWSALGRTSAGSPSHHDPVISCSDPVSWLSLRTAGPAS